jgi:hypothetical protein
VEYTTSAYSNIWLIVLLENIRLARIKLTRANTLASFKEASQAMKKSLSNRAPGI